MQILIVVLQNCESSVVKHFIAKPSLLFFLDLSIVFDPSLYKQYVIGLKVQLFHVTVAFIKQGWNIGGSLIPVIVGKLFQAVDVRGDNFVAREKDEVLKRIHKATKKI